MREVSEGRLIHPAIVVLAAISLSACTASGSPAPGSVATITSPSSTTAPTSPVEGTWLGPVLTIAQAKEVVPKEFWDGVFGSAVIAKKTVQFQVRIGDGRFTAFESDDGGDFRVGQSGNITIDGHRIHLLDDIGAVYTYRWDLSEGLLRLDAIRISAPPTDGIPDRVFQHLIYESQPFTKES